MAGIKNKYDFYKGFLEALGAENITETDYKNEEELRKRILDTLDVEYVFDDVNQTDLFREKFLQGISSGGGGGSSDFSTAEVTVSIEDGIKLYMPYIYEDEDVADAESIIVDSGNYTAILYKGSCFAVATGPSGTSAVATVSGDIVVNETDFTITGNGTITITLE